MTCFVISSLALDCLSKSVPFKFDTAEGCGCVQKEHDLHLNKLVRGQGGKETVPVLLPWKGIQIHCFTLQSLVSFHLMDLKLCTMLLLKLASKEVQACSRTSCKSIEKSAEAELIPSNFEK